MLYKIKSDNKKIDGRAIVPGPTTQLHTPRLSFRKGDNIKFSDTDQIYRIKYVTHRIGATGSYLYTNLCVDR